MFQSLSEVETLSESSLSTLEILTEPMVIQKIQTGCDITVDETASLSHIVELYNFPPTFKTGDLDTVLHKLKLDKYYELIWVDDTHAFAVMVRFKSSKIYQDDVTQYFSNFIAPPPLSL